LADYPILDDGHCSELQALEALEIWQNCFSEKERIEYIRNASKYEFEFHNWADMRAVIRGEYFTGYASDLIG